MEISLCMIVRDEEDVMKRCLDSIKNVVDEIIVVDTGSVDATKRIARNCGAKVYDFEWIDDFAAARNESFRYATKDFIMWFDADDVLTEENAKKLKELKKSLPSFVNTVHMRYDTSFDEAGNATFSYMRERLFRRSTNPKWVGAIHETCSYSQPTMEVDIAVEHRKLKAGDPKRNMRIFESMIAKGQELNARETFYYARELMYNNRLEDAINRFIEFLSRDDCWIENRISAYGDLANCYRKSGHEQKALHALVASLADDGPRAEICCDIGKHWLDNGRYELALFWYSLASEQDPQANRGAFVLPDCYGFIPYIQMCVAYDKLGEKDKAIEANEKAGAIKPDDPSYLYNKKYFESL
ncbi:MAG: glycosyltransferase [Eubacteriaceae bacterium]|nr:glycosyltransferase [Eubacteriaceae bacterium]